MTTYQYRSDTGQVARLEPPDGYSPPDSVTIDGIRFDRRVELPRATVELAVRRLRELMPSFRDPAHHADHADIALVRELEASLGR